MVVGGVGGILWKWDFGMSGGVGLCWVGLSDSGENSVRKNRYDFE